LAPTNRQRYHRPRLSHPNLPRHSLLRFAPLSLVRSLALSSCPDELPKVASGIR
jgi:hypothetical protein